MNKNVFLRKNAFGPLGMTVFFICVFLFQSCASKSSSNNAVEYDAQNLHETDVKEILDLRQSDPVKALFKAALLNEPEIYNGCRELVLQKITESLENKDYVSLFMYYSAAAAYGFDSETGLKADYVDSLLYGMSANSNGSDSENARTDKSPATIKDCVASTVTVLVDKGLKIENGAGYADMVLGSGFFISADGYLITNHHVISDMVDSRYEGFSRLYIKLLSDPDTKIPAKVVGYDPVLDLALLKVEIDAPFVFSLGSSKELTVGDKVSAIGTPLGLEGTLTSGIISSVDRKLLTMGNVFQLDAAVNSGNSGGPLVDENRKVQAIVFAGIQKYQGLNFAIPVEYLKQELPYLYQQGELKHSWLSCYGKTKRNGSKKEGVEVQYVLPSSPAEKVGLKAGCVIKKVQGVSVSTIEDLQVLLMKYPPSSAVKLTYTDGTLDGEEKDAVVYLEVRPEQPGKTVYETDLPSESFVPLFGLKMVSSSTTSRKSYRIENVLKGSAAEDLGFSENDQIVIKETKLDSENGYLLIRVSTKRRTKGFLDFVIVMGTSLDSPYYF